MATFGVFDHLDRRPDVSLQETYDDRLRLIGEVGLNYFVCRFAYGDLTRAEAEASLGLFANQAMDRIAA